MPKLKDLSPLLQAIELGDEEKIKTLLASTQDISKEINEKIDDNNYTILHWATTKKLVSIVQCLLNYGADVNSVNSLGLTPLHCASGIEKYYQFDKKHNESHSRMFENSLIIVKMFLKQGASVNVKDNSGKTPLHYAVDLDVFRPEIIKCLLDSGADINAVCNQDLTPIFYAKNKKIISFLVGKGANINYVSRKEFTPLCHKIRSRAKPILAEILLESGADVNILNAEGKSFLEIVNKPFWLPWDRKILEIVLNKIVDIMPVIRELVRDNNDENNMIPIIMKRAAVGEIEFNVEDLKTRDGLLVEKCVKCTSEIEKLKDTKIEGLNYSFFTILVMPIKKLSTIVKNEEIMDFTSKLGRNSNIVKDFPLYGQMLRKHVEEAMNRKRLVDSSVKAFKKMLFDFQKLRLSDCTLHDIVSFLSNTDLTNLTQV